MRALCSLLNRSDGGAHDPHATHNDACDVYMFGAGTFANENGVYVGPDGQPVDREGSPIGPPGTVVDADGFIVDPTGQRYLPDGGQFPSEDSLPEGAPTSVVPASTNSDYSGPFCGSVFEKVRTLWVVLAPTLWACIQLVTSDATCILVYCDEAPPQ